MTKSKNTKELSLKKIISVKPENPLKFPRYSLLLEDGSVFSSSYDPNYPADYLVNKLYLDVHDGLNDGTFKLVDKFESVAEQVDVGKFESVEANIKEELDYRGEVKRAISMAEDNNTLIEKVSEAIIEHVRDLEDSRDEAIDDKINALNDTIRQIVKDELVGDEK